MCSNCTTQQNQSILVYLFVILIVAIVVFGQIDDQTSLVLIMSAAAAFLYNWFSSSEHLEDMELITNDTEDDPNINTDDTRYSEYGNISLSNDIDTMLYRRADLDFSESVNDSLDNTDTIDEATANYSSNFQPTYSQGVSASSSAADSGFNLGQPDAPASLNYSVPLNDFAYDLDEALARKQQHRSNMNKKAIDGAVRTTRNKLGRVFGNELAENESRVWYSAEATDFETDFHPYY